MPRQRRGLLPLAPGVRSTRKDGLVWVIYVRQSKKRKDVAGAMTTISIEDQESRCRQAIATHDREPTSITVIVDHGRSGRHGARRPGRDQVLELVEAGQATAVMALKAQRIGRSIEESANFWNRCSAAGALVAAADCPDLSSPVVRGALFGMAEQEHQDRAEYSAAIIQHRRAAGKPPVKTGVAYGLRWDGDHLAIVPEEFVAVRRAFELFDDGTSIGEIARILTRARAPRRNTAHWQWDGAAVSRMLRCTWYAGRIPDATGETGYFETGQIFLDRELVARVQGRLRTIEETGQKLERALSGLLYCAECGGWSPMSLCYSRHKRKDGSVQQNDRYRCIHHVRERAFCSGHSIRALDVERFLAEQIHRALGDSDLAGDRLGTLRAAIVERDSEAVTVLDARISAIKDEQRQLYQRRTGGEVIPNHLYNDEMSRLESERVEAERERKRAVSSTGVSRAALKRLEAEVANGGPLNPERWFELPQARRGEFLRLLFPYGVSVSANPDGKRLSAAQRLAVRAQAEADAAEALRSGSGSRTDADLTLELTGG